MQRLGVTAAVAMAVAVQDIAGPEQALQGAGDSRVAEEAPEVGDSICKIVTGIAIAVDHGLKLRFYSTVIVGRQRRLYGEVAIDDVALDGRVVEQAGLHAFCSRRRMMIFGSK